MELSDSYKEKIHTLAGLEESIKKPDKQHFENLVEVIIKRVPVLQYYNKFDDERYDAIHTTLQKHESYGEKTVMMKDEPLVFSSFNIFSELKITERVFNEKNWYYFNFTNEILPILKKNEDLNDLFKSVLFKAIMMTNRNLGFSKEVVLEENEKISAEKITEVIQELNQSTFKFEEYVDKHYKIKFF